MRSYTRRQLKQDQFAAATRDTVSWAVEHRNKLIYGGIVLTVVLAIGLGSWFYTRRQNEVAGKALAQALQTYQAPLNATAQAGQTSFANAAERAKAARAQFAKIADAHPRTRSGQMARYFEGLSDEVLGNTAAAEKELKQAAASGPQDVTSLAKLALANLYRGTGRDGQAERLYKELMDHPTNTVATSAAQLALADLYESKKPQEARRIYEELRKQDPQGAAGQMAASRLGSIK